MSSNQGAVNGSPIYMRMSASEYNILAFEIKLMVLRL